MFSGALYSVLFELCREVGTSERMARALVQRVVSRSASKVEVDIGVEILGARLGNIREHQGISGNIREHE
eukprot:1180795-Prorocentrum_minimum.AAC.2